MPKKTKDETGREILEYKNGLIKDASNGQIIQAPASGQIRTSERGRELARIRWDKAREHAEQAIDDAAKLKGGEGWGKVVNHVAETLLKSSNLRGMAEALNSLSKLAGYTPQEEVRIIREIDPALREALNNISQSLTEAMEARRALGDVIEGTVTDEKPTD